MKKYLIGLCLLFSLGGFFVGGVAEANVLDAGADLLQQGANLAERGAENVGDALRDVEEFNLRMQYYVRPYEEGDLTFDQWKDLYGYGTSGRGAIPSGEFKLPKAELFGDIGANTDLRAYILNVLKWVLSFLGIIAIAVIIFAGYNYIVGGEDGKEKSKSMIIYTAIGILVILSSYAIVNTLITQTLEGGENYEVIQNYVSSEDVVSGGTVEAICQTPEGEDCAYSMGSGGWAVDAYNDVTFSLLGVDDQQNVKWNFGDGVLYPGEDVTGSVVRSFSEDDRWYSIAVMGEFQSDEGIKQFIGQSRVWVGDVAKAQFKVSPIGQPDVGQRVTFDASPSVAAAGTLDKYIWSCDGACGDFMDSAMATPTHGKKKFFYTFDEPGIASVSLVVNAKFGAAGEIPSNPYVMEIAVGEIEPERVDVDFTAPRVVMRKSDVSLVAQGDMDYEYEWEFPADDFVDSGKIMTHQFEDVGAQEIILVAYDEEEEEVAKVSKVVVVGTKDMPVAVAKVNDELVLPSKSIELMKGDMVTISSDSCDENQECGDSAELDVSWSWNGNPVLPSYLEEISSLPGKHALELTVTSTSDAKKEAKQRFNITVVEAGPEVELEVSEEKALGQGFYRLKAKAEADNPIQRYRFEAIEFGKVVEAQMINSSDAETQTIMDLTKFRGAHNFVFRVEVVDENGVKSEAKEEKQVNIEEVLVENTPPEIEIFTTPATSGDTTVSFRFFTRSSDADGDNLTYVWRLPNGKSVMGKSAVHRFTEVGEHVVKVEVSDGTDTVEATQIIEVYEAEESATSFGQNRAPMVQITGVNPGNTGDTNTKFSFFSNASDLDLDELVYEWNFGDGNDSTMKNVTHMYSDPGTYRVILRVSDGIEFREAQVSVRVVAVGEEIPESTLPAYEPEFQSEGLTAGDVSIVTGGTAGTTGTGLGGSTGTGLTSDGVSIGTAGGDLMGAVDAAQEEREQALADCDPTIDDCEALAEEVEMLNLLQAKLDELENETDPVRRQELERENNELLVRIRTANPEFVDGVTTIEGTTATTFFLYGDIDFETDRPIWIEWNTGDGRVFGGQDVSWKYPKVGNYEVVMTVSDGTASVNKTLTIKVK